MHVLFLLGFDYYSTILANEICSRFAMKGFKASFLVFKNELAINSDKLQPEIKDLIRRERTQFNEVVAPYLQTHPNRGEYLGLEALAAKYGCEFAYCSNLEAIHANAFILSQAEQWQADIAIAIRCIVHFDAPLIHYFERDGENYFWNLHPGLLPKYRGIMPMFGAMLNNEIEYGYTLHRISETLDNGPVIDETKSKIIYSQSMLKNILNLIPAGADLIEKNVMEAQKNKTLPCLLQDETQKGYYSFPTAQALQLFKSQGLSLVTREDDDFLRELFKSL